MRHEDFVTLDLRTVLKQWFTELRVVEPKAPLHWISSSFFEHIRSTSETNWKWLFDSAMVLDSHIYFSGPVDLKTLYSKWKLVEAACGHKPVTTPQPVPIQGKSGLVIPVHWQSKWLGYLLLEKVPVSQQARVVQAISKINSVAARYVAFAYEMFEAKNQSYLDDLTGLYNQRYLPMVLEHEIERSKRSQKEFSVLFLDIDFFKMVNDSRGHLVGSKLLVEMSRLIKSSVRSCDYGFRYGGDEFLIVLVGTSPENGLKVAERLRAKVEASPFHVDGHNMKLTVSIGLAGYPQHAQTAQSLIQLADQAMYYGKNKSRNIVFVAS